MNPQTTTHTATITVGATRFARNSAALVDTLFDPAGTASGLFRVRPNGVLFLAPTGEPFAFLCANRHGERFFVSACRQSDGRTRYSFGLAESDQRRLGLAGLGCMAQAEEAERIWKEIDHARRALSLAKGEA